MPLIVRCDNEIVTDTYLEIIGEALSYKCNDIRYATTIKEAFEAQKKETIIVARTIDAFRLILRGYKRIIVWFQGVEPEESYMVHRSKIRYHVLSCMEKLIVRRAIFCFFVSEEMHDHYEKKYNVSFDENRYYCMPCMNTEIHEQAFHNTIKYKKNTFAYIGSLAPWQKFDDTVRVYKKIEDTGLSDCSLRVYTSQEKEAEAILKGQGVQHYSIGFVKNNIMSQALSDVKYGFIIRENNTVNRVATPTKISTYLSCGIIPIYSDCISDFSKHADNMRYVVKLDDNILGNINELSFVDTSDILNEYRNMFKSYYSREYHVSRIVEKIKQSDL